MLLLQLLLMTVSVTVATLISMQPQQTYTVTAYCLQGTMRSGAQVYNGAVAVDPRVIPLGSLVTIEGLNGVFTAEDTGGGVLGNHVDVWMASCNDAINFGRQQLTVEVQR